MADLDASASSASSPDDFARRRCAEASYTGDTDVLVDFSDLPVDVLVASPAGALAPDGHAYHAHIPAAEAPAFLIARDAIDATLPPVPGVVTVPGDCCVDALLRCLAQLPAASTTASRLSLLGPAALRRALAAHLLAHDAV